MNNIRKYIFPLAVICFAVLLMSGCNKNETYTVTFDANGGMGTMQQQTFVEDEPQALRLNEFTCDNCVFYYWSPLKQHVFSIPEDPKHEYRDGETITVSANMTLYAHWKIITRGQLNGHDWVDLGLPSGTKWATCNVGADTPEGYGDYFAWGETTAKTTYSWSTYRYCNGSSSTLTKYCNNSSNGNNGFTDNLTNLVASDDAATANWGAGWRMPTREDVYELYNNCTHEWTTQNGVNGIKFTGTNGNSVFLPAAGERIDSVLGGTYGEYWSSSLCTDDPDLAWYFYFNSDVFYFTNPRLFGFTVRPVYVN